jgi:hypothetical protein
VNFAKVIAFVIVRYERLFKKRFRLESGFHLYPAAISPPRRRFGGAGAIIPTDPALTRCQY